jgi:hypothetical protein
MYTNALLGTTMDKRHVWRPAAKEGLDAALEADEYAALACECGQQEAMQKPDSEGQQHLRLVPVRDLNVETLADFLVHPGTSEPCARCACSTLGLEWPPERASVKVEEMHPGHWTLDDPEYVAKEQHARQAGQAYLRRHADHEQESGEGSADPPQHPNARCDTVPVVDAEVEVQNDLERAGRQPLGRGQQEMEFSIDVKGEAAEELKRFFDEVSDRAARDSR